MKSLLFEILIFLLLWYITGCKGFNRDPYADTPTTGRIKIGVDATYKPIAEAELMVFEGLYKYAEITPLYQPESDCFQLLKDDSVRLILASRSLRNDEKEIFASKHIIPRVLKIATDAVALVVNPANQDTILSLEAVKKVITGKITSWKQLNRESKLDAMSIVFDQKNSSIVHYMLDSICQGESITGQLYALDSNLDVVNYVARNTNALGLIGASWISDRDDTLQLSFLRKIRVVAISKTEPATPVNSYQPYQAYIYEGLYPLSRDLYAIDAEPRNGLATGFMSFLASDRGQRIILKSGILPANAPVRLVNVRDNF
jgi:phosphate transport system substrate-binding protein